MSGKYPSPASAEVNVIFSSGSLFPNLARNDQSTIKEPLILVNIKNVKSIYFLKTIKKGDCKPAQLTTGAVSQMFMLFALTSKIFLKVVCAFVLAHRRIVQNSMCEAPNIKVVLVQAYLIQSYEFIFYYLIPLCLSGFLVTESVTNI